MARNSLKNIVRLIDAEKEVLTPEQSFLHDLERCIEIEDKKNSRSPSQTYKPSSMNCIRQSYYQIVGAAPDDSSPNYSFIGICNAGTDIHVRIQTAVSHMKDNGMDCEWIDVEDFVRSRNLKDVDVKCSSGMETKLYHKKFNLSFMCDGIIRYRGKYYILELKTENSSKFFNRNGVDPGHYNQAVAYSVALELDDIIFVYISRDMLNMKSFLFHVESEQKHGFVSYIDECDGYVKRKVVPPVPMSIDKRVCSYCSYQSQCRKDR